MILTKQEEGNQEDWKDTMIDFSFLSKQDVDRLNDKLDLSDDEIFILTELRKQNLNDEGIMYQMNLSRNKFYKIKTRLIEKMIRLALK